MMKLRLVLPIAWTWLSYVYEGFGYKVDEIIATLLVNLIFVCCPLHK